MNQKKRTTIILLAGIFLVSIGALIYIIKFGNNLNPYDNSQEGTQTSTQEDEQETTVGLMLLIEFEGTEGLDNFAYQMNQRDIPGMLMVNPDFVENNCELIKAMQDNDIEIAGVHPNEALWDVDYPTQYDIIKDTKDRVESCTNESMRVFASRYFAYDENTVKAANELEIEYVMARGTTKAKATIYKPEEYNVKIFSVSNVDSEKWGTGSLCDYSYWAREGTPDDFRTELFNAYEKYDKISPVSHTYIGGLKQRWNTIYTDFFDNTEINWVDLDEFGKVDQSMPFDEIPENREVQYTTPKPATPLEEEQDVQNPCSITSEEGSESENGKGSDSKESQANSTEIVMFHNGTGPMCTEAEKFFQENNIKYTEYLTTDDDFYEKLDERKAECEKSEGVSESFGYYPMIFVSGRCFSGFNEEVENAISSLVSE